MTPATRLEPGDGSPPLIQSQPGPVPLQAEPARQLILVLLNLCLGLFLVDAVLSLADDTLLNLLNVRVLSGVRGILGTFSLLSCLVVYVLLGLVPATPKRLFVPVILFISSPLLLIPPVCIYLFNRTQQVSWIVSCLQVSLGLFVLW